MLNASYFGVNRILGPVPLNSPHSGVDVAVIRKGTTQFFPVTFHKHRQGVKLVTRQAPALRFSFLPTPAFAPLKMQEWLK